MLRQFALENHRLILAAGSRINDTLRLVPPEPLVEALKHNSFPRFNCGFDFFPGEDVIGICLEVGHATI